MNLQRQHRLLIAAAVALGVHALLAGVLLQGRHEFVTNAPVPPSSMPESAAAEPVDDASAKADEPKAAASKPAESAEAAKLVQALKESQPAEDAPATPTLQVPDRARKIAAAAPLPAQALKAVPAVKASKVTLAATSAPAPVPIPPPTATPTPVASSAVVRSTAPPSSSDDDAPAKAAPPAAVSATSSPAALENYAKSVRWRLSKYMHELPAGAKGEARVQFTVKPDGKVSNIQLVQSSGHAGLDALATQLPEQAQPLPSPGPKPVRIEIPIQAAAPK